MPCARVMRGIWSNEKAVTPRSAIARIPAGYASGLSSPPSATPGPHRAELLGRRALDRQQEVGARLDAGGVEHQRTGVAVRVVGEARRVSGAGLDEHLVAVAHQSGHDLRDEGDPPLALPHLAWNPDPQAAPPPSTTVRARSVRHGSAHTRASARVKRFAPFDERGISMPSTESEGTCHAPRTR